MPLHSPTRNPSRLASRALQWGSGLHVETLHLETWTGLRRCGGELWTFGGSDWRADAVGALAVGSCGAYGYGFDCSNESDARTAAMRKCSGGRCRIVGLLHRACAAMSVDAKNPCGSFGWAIDSHLGKAENISMRRCVQFGGHECVVRAWACDEKG